MLEAATTSFQIHLQVDPGNAARIYNAAKALSAPIVAVAANSPYLFGLDLWDETRIPVFEQAVAVGGSERTKRVGFGIRYVEASIFECFEANLHRYPVLLPRLFDEPPERLAHLALHNGTIWRWNRPLIGFGEDGAPHLRIEHRVVPAGPTVADSIANAALFYGAVHALAARPDPIEHHLPFTHAHANFYAAARTGLPARLHWRDGETMSAAELVIGEVLPLAREGLGGLGIDAGEIAHWLGIIADRAASGQTGAAWQRAWVHRHGPDMQAMTLAYLDRQRGGRPVHQWDI